MSTKIFVNLPVKDLDRSIDFFTRLGYSFNKQFSDERGACLVVSEHIYAMLLVEPFFQTLTRKPVADATKGTEVILALGVESREQVDGMVDRALASGGQPLNDPIDDGHMYVRSFQDPDGHEWELMWMDPAAVQTA
jgi:predicted lactoylglutathione lyase